MLSILIKIFIFFLDVRIRRRIIFLRNIILIFSLSISGIVAAQMEITEKITFRDIELGIPDVRDKISDICNQHKFNNKNSCKLEKKSVVMSLSYGNIDEIATVMVNSEGALEQVEFASVPTMDLIPLVALLSEKYGNPRKITSYVSNKIGGKFEKNRFTWIDKNVNTILIDSIYENINFGRVIIVSGERVKMLMNQQNNTKEIQKSNL